MTSRNRGDNAGDSCRRQYEQKNARASQFNQPTTTFAGHYNAPPLCSERASSMKRAES